MCENPSHWSWARSCGRLPGHLSVLSVMQFIPPIGACFGGVSEKPCQLEVRRVCRRCNSTAGTMHECRYENAFRGQSNLTSMHYASWVCQKVTVSCMICFRRGSRLYCIPEPNFYVPVFLCLSKSLHPVYRLASGGPAVR